MEDIKRICSLCGMNRTPFTPGGIYQVNDRRGNPLGLFGACCCNAVNQAVLESPQAYREEEARIREWIIKRAKELTTKKQVKKT